MLPKSHSKIKGFLANKYSESYCYGCSHGKSDIKEGETCQRYQTTKPKTTPLVIIDEIDLHINFCERCGKPLSKSQISKIRQDAFKEIVEMVKRRKFGSIITDPAKISMEIINKLRKELKLPI